MAPPCRGRGVVRLGGTSHVGAPAVRTHVLGRGAAALRHHDRRDEGNPPQRRDPPPAGARMGELSRWPAGAAAERGRQRPCLVHDQWPGRDRAGPAGAGLRRGSAGSRAHLPLPDDDRAGGASGAASRCSSRSPPTARPISPAWPKPTCAACARCSSPITSAFRSAMSAVRAFCDARGIALIEDCAHAFFGVSEGRADRQLGRPGDRQPHQVLSGARGRLPRVADARRRGARTRAARPRRASEVDRRRRGARCALPALSRREHAAARRVRPEGSRARTPAAARAAGARASPRQVRPPTN